MKSLLISFLVFAAVLSSKAPALAQQGVWIQIEAHPSLSVAQQRAKRFAEALPDVNGFSLGRGWYGILIGPYTRSDAERVLQVYQAERQIPSDSFIAQNINLGAQYWPALGNTNAGLATAPETPEPSGSEITLLPRAEPADETPAQARRSEQALNAADRRALQTALQASGFYSGAIDGAFGRGTRASMSAWQRANGFEETGILTTAQRQVLMDDYNAPLISAGMQLVSDPQAGIRIQIPTAMVRFSNYEPPFAHYTGALDARVVLISQPGTRATLAGLYDIMQSLEIVPLDGPRNRDRDSFEIEGRGNGINSYTQASLKGGEIKGFTLVWPEGDRSRFDRVVAVMKASFTRTDGVLDPAIGDGNAQQVDLVSGLEIRKPRLSRSGFYVDQSGTVLTTGEAVAGCTRVELDQSVQAQVVAESKNLGIAVLRPVTRLQPMQVASLSTATPRLQSDIVVSGYSYEGILGAPTLTYGKLADIKGLGGETTLSRLDLLVQEGDVGGPVLDGTGAVLGVLTGNVEGARQLPEGVRFAANADAIRSLLTDAGVTARDSSDTALLPPNAMARLTSEMTVLVSCWD